MVKLLKTGAAMTQEQLNLILKALPSLDDPQVKISAGAYDSFNALRFRASF